MIRAVWKTVFGQGLGSKLLESPITENTMVGVDRITFAPGSLFPDSQGRLTPSSISFQKFLSSDKSFNDFDAYSENIQCDTSKIWKMHFYKKRSSMFIIDLVSLICVRKKYKYLFSILFWFFFLRKLFNINIQQN